jgi:hypothetical protein
VTHWLSVTSDYHYAAWMSAPSATAWYCTNTSCTYQSFTLFLHRCNVAHTVTIRLFGVVLAERLQLMSDSPSTYIFIHWFVGLPVVLCVSRVIDVLRKIVKEDYLKVYTMYSVYMHTHTLLYIPLLAVSTCIPVHCCTLHVHCYALHVHCYTLHIHLLAGACQQRVHPALCMQ